MNSNTDFYILIHIIALYTYFVKIILYDKDFPFFGDCDTMLFLVDYVTDEFKFNYLAYFLI